MATSLSWTGTDVTLTHGYQRLDGLRTGLAATIDGVDDFVNAYQYLCPCQLGAVDFRDSRRSAWEGRDVAAAVLAA